MPLKFAVGVNVIAPVLTKRDALLLQTIYHPFVLFAEHAKGISLTPRIESPDYSAGSRGNVPVLDAAATFDAESGSVCAFLVHRERERPLSVDLRLDDRRLMGKVSAIVLGGGAVQLQNDWDHPDRVQPREVRVEQGDSACRLEIPAPGLAIVQLPTTGR